MPRPANPQVRVNLIAAGLQLIRMQGVKATGVKDIAERAGVPKGSFYGYFTSKDEFVVAALESYWAELERDVACLLKRPCPPLERLRSYFRSIAVDHESNAFTLGCLIGNLGLEVAGSSTVVAARLRGILDLWEAQVANVFSHVDDHRRREVAALIIEAWEGAVFRAKVDGSREPYTRFESFTLPRLTALCSNGWDFGRNGYLRSSVSAPTVQD
ncbi:MAG: TetR family transcriptional regulator C-terminal domain-containing protein [Mycobacterium sp.]